ncbi:hypothetical protein ACJIZ3_014971 [Penstemon smallii]|uniref:Growth-regulating factor n=1 Tax=Penstemon smallii TaxID=265156 RepID=A0ABD3RLE5_9LAMI
MDFVVVGQNSGFNDPNSETGHGSGNPKHQRSGLSEDSWKIPKVQRCNEVDFCSNKSGNKTFAGFGGSDLFDDGHKMLSFSSYSEPQYSRSIAFSVSQDEHHSRKGGGSNEVMKGPFARVKGPFTPSQWMELEHQALIYKHIVANVPVPSNLLVPLKRSLYSYISPGSYASNLLGWGPFHLGFPSGSNDPEPGRCRRTDGKKWRCSKDAVPDQKYCERHINRGRHRSRKPVEGQTGRSVISKSTTTSKVLQPLINASTQHLDRRTKGIQGVPLVPSTVDLKSKDEPLALQKQHVSFEESSLTEFGLVSSDSLVNPSEKFSFLGFNEKESTHNQLPVHHFIDDWPKDQSNQEDLSSDWTQLTMSIPVASEKSTMSTLTLSSHELDPIHMSLGLREPIQKQPWLPISWGNLMGGPLGEVLTTTSTSEAAGKSSSSPTGVLSNCSSGSSPHSTDNNKMIQN